MYVLKMFEITLDAKLWLKILPIIYLSSYIYHTFNKNFNYFLGALKTRLGIEKFQVK